MDCAECQTDPLTPGHYCPCCGRKLSLQEQRALEATLPACAPVIARAIVTEPSHDSTPAVAETAVLLDTTPEVTLSPPVVNADDVKIAKAKAVADLTAQAHLAKAANPTPVVRRPIVPVPPQPQRHSHTPMLMMAAAVIVGAIGAAEGARRLGFEWPGRDVREAPPVQVAAAVESATPPARPAMSRDTQSASKVTPESKVVTANRGSAVAPSRSAARPKAGPAKPPAAKSARPTATLTGRLFDSTDVDEPPRIATRVEPRLPANLPAGADKKIVVARVLVSRTGHPHHVSLLRGSLLGRAADEAVVAAVTQWTFSPAKRRGEAVNCWYNIGVPLGHAH